jgi:xeroderma pigmentosum group C-complementing protein
VANEEQEQREREKREKRVYDNWRRLIRGLLIRERIQAKYFRNITEDDDLPPVIDSGEKGVGQATLSNKNTKSTNKQTSNKRKKK